MKLIKYMYNYINIKQKIHFVSIHVMFTEFNYIVEIVEAIFSGSTALKLEIRHKV